jgi:hypothetical protein
MQNGMISYALNMCEGWWLQLLRYIIFERSKFATFGSYHTPVRCRVNLEASSVANTLIIYSNSVDQASSVVLLFSGAGK